MKTRIKILTSLLLIAVLLMSLVVSASAAPYTEPPYNAAVGNSTWTIYGIDGEYLKKYSVNYGVVIGPGSSDSQYSGQSPVSAAQAGLNILLRCYPMDYSKMVVDGIFGDATTEATKDFQAYVYYNLDSNVLDDGWIGSLTWPYLAQCSKVAFDW